MAFRSSSLVAGASATSLVINVPASAAINDIAVVCLYKESTAAVTPAASFTSKAVANNTAASRGSLEIFWKRLSAADTGTYTYSWTGACWRTGVAGLWSGRTTTGDPWDTVATAESTTSVSTSPAVSTSPVGSNGDAIFFATDFTGGNAWTPPTNYTEKVDQDEIELATRDAVASGTTGSLTAAMNVSGFSKAFIGVLAVSGGAAATSNLLVPRIRRLQPLIVR